MLLFIVNQVKERLIKRCCSENLFRTALLQLPTRLQQLTNLQIKSNTNPIAINTLKIPIILLCLPKISTILRMHNYDFEKHVHNACCKHSWYGLSE